MKKLAMVAAVLTLGMALATPAVAGHRGHRRGHHQRVLVGGHLSYLPHPRFHPISSVSVSFGYPVYTYPRYYPPAPIYYYAPAPIYVAPAPWIPVWIPGRYIWDGGARIYVEGHWSR